MPPPVALDDEDENEFVKQQASEIERLKAKGRALEENLRISHNNTARSSGGVNVQSKILQELEYLKGNPESLS